MRGLRVLTLALAAAAVPSCVFVLDFDELQEGDGADAGSSGGNGGAGGSGAAGAGAGGAGGSAGSDACGGCDDGDPCTRDTCDTSGSTPRCAFTPEGLKPDGLSVTRSFDGLERVTLASSGDRFYLSVFGELEGELDVALFGFGRSGGAETFTEGARFSTLRAGPLLTKSPASVGGLLPIVSGFDTRIYAFVALQPTLGLGDDAEVWQLVFGDDLQVIESGAMALGGANYLNDDPTTYPVPWTSSTSDEHYVAWRGRGGIYVTKLDTPLGLFQQPQLQVGGVRHIAPFTTPGRTGLIQVGDSGVSGHFFDDPLLDVAAPNLSAPASIQQCNTFPGGFTSVQTVDAQIPGLYFTTWSKSADDFIGTELVALFCGEQGPDTVCAATPESCADGDRLIPGLRNPNQVLLRRSSDPADTLHVFSAFSIADPDDGDAGLLLQMQRSIVDTEEAGNTVSLGTVTLLESWSPGEDFADYPVLALSGEDKLAAAWIEPSSGGAQLRVERFDICYPSTF